MNDYRDYTHGLDSHTRQNPWIIVLKIILGYISGL